MKWVEGRQRYALPIQDRAAVRTHTSQKPGANQQLDARIESNFLPERQFASPIEAKADKRRPSAK